MSDKPLFGTGQWTHDHELCYALGKVMFDERFGADERDLIMAEEPNEKDPYEYEAELVPAMLTALLDYWNDRNVSVKLMDGTRIYKASDREASAQPSTNDLPEPTRKDG